MSGEKSLLVNLFGNGKYCSIIVRNRKIKNGKPKYVQTKLSVVFSEDTEGLRKISGMEENQTIRIPKGPMSIKIGSACEQMYPFCQDEEEFQEEEGPTELCSNCCQILKKEGDGWFCGNCGGQSPVPPAIPRKVRVPPDPVKRVHDIAREFGVTSKLVIEKCLKLNIRVKDHASFLTQGQADRLRAKFGSA
jgi:hypothetical protein